MKNLFMVIMIMTTTFFYAQKDTEENTKWTSGRPDGHAPISIMGDHMHGKGEWMFSYRYMNMVMDDLKQGKDNTSVDNALANYMVTPTKMPMQIHMLGIMYAPSHKVTLMIMGNFISSNMDHITRMGMEFNTEASGFGDLKISGMYKLFNKHKQTIHAQLGISIPTGNIDIEDAIPASAPNEVTLPYPMQIGSGTFDTELAFTYLGQCGSFSWGNQLKSTFRFGENKRDYRLGNKYGLNNWIAVKTTNWLSFSARLEGLIISEIEGSNPDLNPMMVITADTQNSGGTYINTGFGFNTYISKGALKNIRFGFEFALPIYQDLNGIQLKQKETLTFGLQYSFK